MGGSRLEKSWRWSRSNLDVLAVIAVAVPLGSLSLLGVTIAQERLLGATLGVLGLVALIAARDRLARERGIDWATDLLASDRRRPYLVVSDEVEWDIESRDQAVSTRTQTLKIAHDECSVIHAWCRGDGGESSIEGLSCSWRPKSSQNWVPAKQIHKHSHDGGTKFLFTLGQELNLGDEIGWKVERKLKDRFPSSHESLALRSANKAEIQRKIKITWPKDSAPHHVEVLRRNASGEILQKEPAPVKHRSGRACIDVSVPYGKAGDDSIVSWYW